MSSLITARLYNADNTPKLLASPKLTAIRQSDKAVVLNSVDMDEVWNWFYQYEYSDYNKDVLYFFSIDSEVYDWVNNLDSYGNKNTRGRDNSVIINTESLAKDIWSAKAKENNKEWTMGAVVQKPISFTEIVVAISGIQEQTKAIIDKIANQINDNTTLTIKSEVAKIKIPKAREIDYEGIGNVLNNVINNSVKDLVMEAIDECEDWKEENDDSYETKEIMGDMLSVLSWLSDSITSLNDWIEWMTHKELKDWVIAIDFSWFIDKMKEKDIEKIESMWIKVWEDINIVKRGIMNLSAKLDK